ncbi:hypothetical protein DRQ36_00275 [bacterium]|nr:MAG: hypothetical protein DRQ36_00275 [bacterium]
MGFVPSKRKGLLWEDAKRLNETILKCPFNTTGKDEKAFEMGFSTTLVKDQDSFNNDIRAQILKSSKVESIYCFGKKHRPDLAIDEDGIAIEIKLIDYEGLKHAIGQGFVYRLKYKFVFLILIIEEKKKDFYEDLAGGKEKDLEDLLTHLSEKMNIFTYIVPNFNIVKLGMKKNVSFFK